MTPLQLRWLFFPRCYPGGICPCRVAGEDWPPATFPCGVLQEQYAISNEYISPHDSALVLARGRNTSSNVWWERRLKSSPTTVTAAVNYNPETETYGSCFWQNAGGVWQERYSDADPEPVWQDVSGPVQLLIHPQLGQWWIYGGGGTIVKGRCGLTPVGDYLDDDEYDAGVVNPAWGAGSVANV